MIDTLPENVQLFENSSLLKWEATNDKVKCYFSNGTIHHRKLFLQQMDF